MTPEVDGAVFRAAFVASCLRGVLIPEDLCPLVAVTEFCAAFVASCLRGAFPPVDFRAVCFVRAITCQRSFVGIWNEKDYIWL